MVLKFPLNLYRQLKLRIRFLQPPVSLRTYYVKSTKAEHSNIRKHPHFFQEKKHITTEFKSPLEII